MNPRFALFYRQLKTLRTMCDYEQYDVGVVASGSSSGPVAASGHTKRLRAAALPKVFLVMTAGHIFGAMLVLSCQLVGDSAAVSWCCDRFVAIKPVLLTKDMAMYMSSVFLLKPLVEKAIRAGPTLAGGVLNHHYLEHAQCQWKVWKCSEHDAVVLRSFDGEHVCLSSKLSLCTLLGVKRMKVS